MKLLKLLLLITILLIFILAIIQLISISKILTTKTSVDIQKIAVKKTSISIKGSLSFQNQNVFNSYTIKEDKNILYIKIYESWTTLRKIQSDEFMINLNGDFKHIDKIILNCADGDRILYSK